ncbi:hypothetical protein F4677DRAFT_459641 [Hypoxylon crocopeplum]|nr:hypothetical protein F4677DRAFT_459641 [Hypoxylon crocopeplum]
MAPVVYHANVIHPGMDAAEIEAMVNANTDAISLSNAAGAAYRSGQYDEAIRLNQQALALKLRAYPEASVQAAISLNALGESLLGAGRLQEADEAFAKALPVRESEGPGLDAAVTRDNIGALREAQGRFADAREIRLRGQQSSKMVCGNYNCPTIKTFALKELHACGACGSVFYCSKGCQVQDWAKRHKPLCRAHSASLQASNQEATG